MTHRSTSQTFLIQGPRLVRERIMRLLSGGRLERVVPQLTLVAAVLIYVGAYYFSDERPGGFGKYPLGWWSWADQGLYIKSVRAFAHLNFAASEHFYPPLYSLITAPLIFLSGDHPFFIPNLVFFTFYVFAFLHVTQRYYGPYLPGLVLLCIFGFFPVISVTQWVVPWTTSLQAALASCLILIFFRAESQEVPFKIHSRAEWFRFFAFFVAYGALAPTRPLDIAVWFPFALYFFTRTLITTTQAAFKGQRLQTFFLCSMTAAVGGLLFVSFYVIFNFAVFGTPFGTYGGVASGNFYLPSDIVEKAYSIFRSSGPLYGEQGQAFIEQIPATAPVLAVCVTALWLLKGIRRWILATAFLHFIVYLPYGDLLPTGVFRYYNLHYFKWAYPWLVVIAVGQTLVWLSGALRRGKGLKPLTASAITLALIIAADMIPVDSERVQDFRRQDARAITIRAAREREADFVDIIGVKSGFNPLYFGRHRLLVDDVPSMGDVRVLPIQGGARLLFLRPRTFSKLELSLEEGVDVGPSEGVSIISSYGYAFGCSFHECSQPSLVPWTNDVIRIDFRDSYAAYGLLDHSAWWGIEPWGQWSRADIAGLNLQVQPRPAISASATIIPLLTQTRPRQAVSLLANGCTVAKVDFTLASPTPRTVEGDIPTDCLEPSGRLRLEVQTDGLRRPVDLGVNQDTRHLGVGVSEVVLKSPRRASR